MEQKRRGEGRGGGGALEVSDSQKLQTPVLEQKIFWVSRVQRDFTERKCALFYSLLRKNDNLPTSQERRNVLSFT